MIRLLDDHLLLEALLGERTDRSTAVATTGLWYHRLSRALIASPVTGALSRELVGLGSSELEGVVAALTQLPDDVELVSLRDLAGPMARLLADGIRLNLLSLEALAAAEYLSAVICLHPDDVNPSLVAAATDRGVPIEISREP